MSPNEPEYVQPEKRFVCPRCKGTISTSTDGSLPLCTDCGQTLSIDEINTGKVATLPHLVEDYRGCKVGPYLVEELLGSGGMGCVFKARRKKDGKLVAIKFLYRQFAKQKDFISQFQKEAIALTKLDHPNIVHIIAEGHFQETYYYIMEYVEGKSLKDILEIGAMEEARVKEIAIEITSALLHAHSQGITHRDIKPENIIITRSGVKILDFGIAHLAYDIPTFHTLTISNDMIGTFVYMAPEQKLGKPVDARADLYSLGIVLYQMLTGEVPMGVFEPPTVLKPNLNPLWDKVLSKLLQRDPEKRYRSAEELLEVLEGRTKPKKKSNWYYYAAGIALILLLSILLYENKGFIRKQLTIKRKTAYLQSGSADYPNPPLYEPPPPAPKPKEYLIAKTPILRFWIEPSKNSKMIAQLKAKDIMEVVEQTQGLSDGKMVPWYKVIFKDKEGYVEAGWVRPATEDEVKKATEGENPAAIPDQTKAEPKPKPTPKPVVKKPAVPKRQDYYGFPP